MQRLLLFLFLSSISECFAAAPVLYFSDMTDGPITGWEESATKGAAVSLWGLNFGGSRGASYVTCGGVNLTSDSDYGEWGATTNPTTARGLQRIAFYLNSSMSTGATTISVTTSEGTSSTISFYCRAIGSSHIYFFTTDGSDANNGLYASAGEGSDGPKQTTAWARGNLTAGDVAYFRSGTWTTMEDDTFSHYAIMNFRASNSNNGTENNSITVTSYPGELAQFGSCPVGVGTGGTQYGIYRLTDRFEYWTFSKLKMEAYRSCVSTGSYTAAKGSNHWRLVGIDGTTSYTNILGDGVVFMIQAGGTGATNLYLLGNYLHDPQADYRGQTTDRRIYQIYIEGYGDLDYVYVGYNELGWNTNGRAFQLYGHTATDTADHVYFYGNYCHHTGRQGAIMGGGDGGTYGFIQEMWVYNNIIHDVGLEAVSGDVAIQFSFDGGGRYGGDFYVYNNVFSSPRWRLIGVSDDLDSIDFKNNIFYLGTDHPYMDYYGTDNEVWSGDHNLWYQEGSNEKPSWDDSTLDGEDPLFVDSTPETYDEFTLQATSPAKDSGTPDVSGTVALDFLGISRPQNSVYDIGAYEREDAVPPSVLGVTFN